MRPPQYKLETNDADINTNNLKTETSNLLGGAPSLRSDQFVVKDFKCAKMRALVPQQTALFPTSGSGEQLIIQDLDVSPVIPFFETMSSYYPKEVDQVIHNAIFIAHHIGNTYFILLYIFITS